MVNAPAVVVALMLILIAIHLGRGFLSASTDFRILVDFSFIPARLTAAIDSARLNEILQRAASLGGEDGEQQLALAQFVLAGGARAWTLVTYALLHGSWLHLSFNLLWLLAFGSPVARRFGPARFLVLCVVCAASGAAAHGLSHPEDLVPMVGASAAISGAMAAAARFVFQPGLAASVLVRDPDADRLPAESLGEVLRDRRALTFIVVWFVSNLAFGLLAGPLGVVTGGIAWEAHIGGFIAGLLLFPLIDPVSPPAGRG